MTFLLTKLSSVVTQVWWLLVLIGVMILIHELGHFWAARAFGVRVDVFSFGFGPRLFGFKRGDTDYRFSLFLLGGYVKMSGDQPGDAVSNDPGSFLSKPRWQRLIISFAGPFMNMVLAVGLLTGLFMVKYEKIIDQDGAVIGHVIGGSPAEKAGIRAGDKIVRLEGKVNPDWEDIVTKEIGSVARPMHVAVEREGQVIEATVTPVLDEREGLGSAGWEGRNEIQVMAVTEGMPAAVAGLRKGDVLLRVNGVGIHSSFTLPETIRRSEGKPVTIDYVREGTQRSVVMEPVLKNLDGTSRWMIGVAPGVKFNIQKTSLSFPAALNASISENSRYATLIVTLLRGMVERRMPAKNLSGPVGIADQAAQAAKEGPSAFLRLMSMVSLNLAILNLLPIPILDGAMILTLLIEMLMGRDISMVWKENALKLGFVFLMMLMVFVLYNDIARRVSPGLILPTPTLTR